MKITFYGAAQTVTGSMHLVEANGRRILLDCGLYQGHRKEAFERNRNIPVDPATIDAVILSHAHIDHSGNLPQLVRRGFRGRVYARQATIDLAEVMLRDSCWLQQRDLEYVNKKRRAQGKKLFEPLYDEEDVDALLPLFEPVHTHRPREISKGLTLTFFNAGHILGSAQTMLDVDGGSGHSHRLLFSGDLGQPNQPILRHYEYPQGADIVLVESTYADRLHPSSEDVEGRLKGYIDDIVQQRSKLIIPAFSVGRTQQILYYLNRLLAAGRIRQVPVYIDSPLSQKATAIYEKHTGCYNDDAMRLLNSGVNPLTFPGMQFVETPQQSMSLNELRGPMVIVAASGMCEGGRVVHHLKAAVGDPRNIILIVGFQAEGTLGRRLVEHKDDTVKMLGEEVRLEARVHTINALSAHADRKGLMDWYDGIKGKVRQAFAVHGETDRVNTMTELLSAHGCPRAVAPAEGQSFVFD
ncbi:MAG: MBL fold metallo-hydrolase [Kiritimatiellae bacterium]|nr:MBL fold metallo-hydrolase [Kiritimatiellia bacterium]